MLKFRRLIFRVTLAHLLCVIHDEVHILVEPDDVAFDARVDVFEEPNRDSRSILKVPENQVDGLEKNGVR